MKCQYLLQMDLFFFFNLQLKYFGSWAGLIFGKCIALILVNIFGIEY